MKVACLIHVSLLQELMRFIVETPLSQVDKVVLSTKIAAPVFIAFYMFLPTLS